MKHKLTLHDLPDIVKDLFLDDSNGRPSKAKYHLSDFNLKPRPLQAGYAQMLANAWSVDPDWKSQVSALKAEFPETAMTSKQLSNWAMHIYPSVSIQSAECGTGKTLAYCIVAALYYGITGRRIAIYTNTLALQQQITKDGGDMGVACAIAKKITGRAPRIARLVSRRNFASAQAVDAIIERRGSSLSQETLDLLNDIRARIERQCDPARPGYHWSDTLIDNIFEDDLPIPYGITKEWFQATGKETHIGHEIHQEAASQADIVVMTHARMIMDLLGTKTSDPTSFETRFPFGAIVVDEAELLASQASTLIRRDVSLFSLWRATRETEDGKAIEKSIIAIDKFLGAAKKDQSIPGWDESTGASKEHAIVLDDLRINEQTRDAFLVLVEKLASQVKRATKRDAILENERRNLEEFDRDLQEFIRNQSPRGVSFSPEREFPTLSVGYASPAWLFAKLYRADTALRHVFFTSATLKNFFPECVTQKDLFKTFETAMGIQRVIGKTIDAFKEGLDAPKSSCLIDRKNHCGHREPLGATEFGTMRLYSILGNMPHPLENVPGHPDLYQLTEAHAMAVLDLARSRQELGKRVLILTQSKRDNQRMAGMLAKHRYDTFRDSVLVDEEGADFKQLRTRYEKTSDAVLISWRAGQGIDMPGLVPNLIICRLPVAPPPSPIDVALLANFLEKTKKVSRATAREMASRNLHARNINRSLHKFRQWLGRGIRKQDDDCKAFIMDPRFPLAGHLKNSVKPLFRRLIKESLRFKHRTEHSYLKAIADRFRNLYDRTGGAIIIEKQRFNKTEG